MLSYIRDGDMLCVQEVDRLGRNLLEGLIVLNDLFQRGIAVKVLEGIAAGEHTERSLILALALSEDRRRDIVRKTKDGLEAARRRGRVGGSPARGRRRQTRRDLRPPPARGIHPRHRRRRQGLHRRRPQDPRRHQGFIGHLADTQFGTARGGKPRPDASLTPLTVPSLLNPRILTGWAVITPSPAS
ncbi:recombinase family protein [Planomonospora corallina]|uniref:Recombinase family protein n=1 Tax=Planomonospora corallina TaxID=1806052 RepID=A0ABV8II47_9ACTN